MSTDRLERLQQEFNQKILEEGIAKTLEDFDNDQLRMVATTLLLSIANTSNLTAVSQQVKALSDFQTQVIVIHEKILKNQELMSETIQRNHQIQIALIQRLEGGYDKRQ